MQRPKIEAWILVVAIEMKRRQVRFYTTMNIFCM